MRTYSPSPTVYAPSVPIFQLGSGGTHRRRLTPRMRYNQTVSAPKTPLHQLGRISRSSFLGADIVGAVVGVIGGLWAAHELRLKNATEENSMEPELVQAFDEGLKTVFNNANDGTWSESDALTALDAMSANYWSIVNNFVKSTKGKGTAVSACGISQYDPALPNANDPGKTGKHGTDASKFENPWGTHCGGSTCTALCCIGCNNLEIALANARWVFQNGGGTARIPAIGAQMSKYGSYSGRAEYTLTYTKPSSLFSASGGASSSVSSSSASSVLSSSVAGIPMWALLAGVVAIAVL